MTQIYSGQHGDQQRNVQRKVGARFGIAQENQPPRLAPFGWDWEGNELVENAKEQTILCEILQLNGTGKGCKLIAAELNRRHILSKSGGRWWSSSIQNILNRFRKKPNFLP